MVLQLRSPASLGLLAAVMVPVHGQVRAIPARSGKLVTGAAVERMPPLLGIDPLA
jgi:hypothetical protein